MEIFLLSWTAILLLFSNTVRSDIPSAEDEDGSYLDNSPTSKAADVTNSSYAICASTACLKTAQSVLSNLNQTLDPCDDFYQYACGGWIDEHRLMDNQTEYSRLRKLMGLMQYRVIEMLENGNVSTFLSENKTKELYVQCKDQEMVEELRSKPLVVFLEKKMGGWPILAKQWNASQFDLMSVLLDLRVYGEESLLSVFVGEDFENPNQNILYIGEPTTFAKKDVLLSDGGDRYIDSYIDLIANVTKLLFADVGDKRDIAEVFEDVDDIIDLSCYLTSSKFTALEGRDLDQLRNKTTLGDIQRTMNFQSDFLKSLTEYVSIIFEDVGLSENITSKTRVVFKNHHYFVRLDEKLVKLEQMGDEGNRILANYIGWRVITSDLEYLSKDYRATVDDFQREIQGQAAGGAQLPATMRCAAVVTDNMPLAVGAMYVRDFVPPTVKSRVTTIVKNVKRGFRGMLKEAVWMDTATLTLALKKLSAMMLFVGYSDAVSKNTSAVDEEYKDLMIGKTYFGTLLEISKRQNFKSLRKLAKENLRDDPIDDAFDITTVNAYNNMIKNFIVVLAATLQSPIYGVQDPLYMNYGRIGYFVGHEITHGFDDQGASFDSVGNMRKWWTDETMITYREKTKHIAEQYDSYHMPYGKVNGYLTLGENIADNGGIKAAYRGYRIARKKLKRPERLLQGLEKFTQEQLFFISVSQVWCSNTRAEAGRMALLTDNHSPVKYRVIGPMSNMPEFATAFNCSVGSNMNPAVKHVVW